MPPDGPLPHSTLYSVDALVDINAPYSRQTVDVVSLLVVLPDLQGFQASMASGEEIEALLIVQLYGAEPDGELHVLLLALEPRRLEEVVDGPKEEPGLLILSEDGEGFAGTCLTVGEEGRSVTVHGMIYKGGEVGRLKHFLLRRGRRECHSRVVLC